jgi:mono/diheme cytochrome c family protein
MNLRFISLVGLASFIGACANGTSDNGFGRPTAGGGGSSNGGGFGVGGSQMIGQGVGASTGSAGTLVINNPDADKVMPTCTSACSDFPAEPIFDTGVGPGDVGGFPGDATQLGGAPSFCLMEPQLGDANNPGAMFPANWLRPRFRWDGAAGAIFQIRLHADVEANELVAYTKSDHWLLPFEIWQKVGLNVRHIDVTVRALVGGQVSGTKGGFEIAPVTAGGTMVYWGTTQAIVSPTASFLATFQVGDEAVVPALTPPQVNTAAATTWGPVLNENGKDLRGQYDSPTDPNSTVAKGFRPGQVQCIGCHIQTADKTAVIFTDDWPWSKIVASVDPTQTGATPAFMTPGGIALLKQGGLGTSTTADKDLAPDLWSDSAKVIVTSYYQNVAGTIPRGEAGGEPAFGTGIDTSQGKPLSEKLIWMNLATTAPIPPAYGGLNGGMDAALQASRNAGVISSRGSAWDYVTVTGETFPANILPNWSKDGKILVYTAAQGSQNGGLDKTRWVEADLHYVPFDKLPDNTYGGQAAAVPGASDPGVMEYYPAWSPDHLMIAYNRVEDRTLPGYYNRFAEINIVNDKGQRIRLAANDPVACSGDKSPGIFNSWPRWAPNVKKADQKDFFFVVFSSARKYPNPVNLGPNPNNPGIPQIPSQLYIAAVVRDASGAITTYPAIYLWNQAYEQQPGATTIDPAFRGSNNLTPAWSEIQNINTVTIMPGSIR